MKIGLATNRPTCERDSH